jgi:hypothetical protein
MPIKKDLQVRSYASPILDWGFHLEATAMQFSITSARTTKSRKASASGVREASRDRGCFSAQSVGMAISSRKAHCHLDRITHADRRL